MYIVEANQVVAVNLIRTVCPNKATNKTTSELSNNLYDIRASPGGGMADATDSKSVI